VSDSVILGYVVDACDAMDAAIDEKYLPALIACARRAGLGVSRYRRRHCKNRYHDGNGDKNQWRLSTVSRQSSHSIIIPYHIRQPYLTHMYTYDDDLIIVVDVTDGNGYNGYIP
jgi:hypothetical protein